MKAPGWKLLTVPLRSNSDLSRARLRARTLAGVVGLSAQEQARLVAATSELVRNVLARGSGGQISFSVEDGDPQVLWVSVLDPNRHRVGRGAGPSEPGHEPPGVDGLAAARRLMDRFESEENSLGAWVLLGKERPRHLPRLERRALEREIERHLEEVPAEDSADELARQNRELLSALEQVRAQQEQLAQANLELKETNRGVVALHAELDARAEVLQEASELKSRLLSLTSHEFRTPLGSIRLLSQILLSGADGPLNSAQEVAVRLIEKMALELGQLVDDLLDLNKAEAGRLIAQPTAFAVESLFAGLRATMRPLLQRPEVELRFESDAGLTMETDESKVTQILRNLVSNALKFTEQGEIRVSARAVDADSICFEVSDTGIGIAPEHQQRVFEEFTQIASPLQSGVKGTGLGLSLVQRLASLLGGTVALESEPGRGTRFTVTLPRHLPHAGTQASLSDRGGSVERRDRELSVERRDRGERVELREEPPPPGLPEEGAPEPSPPARGDGPLHVLVVDDDPAARHVLAHLLRELGCEVTEARDGAQGLWLARRSPPEAIFLDLEMPALSGWEVLPQLHAEPRTRQIPVVLYTGRPQAERERARLGAQGLLRKRGDTAELRREVHRILAQLGLPLGEGRNVHV